jgi:hypothetical protein
MFLSSRNQNGLKFRAVERQSAIPSFLKVWWFCSSPFAFAFAARILWEKTVWTWSRGPQMVGFSLMHIHPVFAVFGILCCLAVMIWIVAAIPFAISRRGSISIADVGMFVCALFVTASVAVPDNFFV